MKLISCHIENYGKISNTDINFNDCLTTLCEANGYGKTTLASFLKAMFYGLDTDRARGEFNERRHFNPFNGGNFGGNVTFLWQDKTFKIERFFDEKSEVKDTVTVYCNGVLTPEYGGDIGERIFGIDRQSFERTVFISGTEIEISSTSSINTKLNNFLEGGNDDTNLEAVLAKLEVKSKEYKKSRQGNDLITQENQHINDLTESISNIQAIASGLPAKNNRLKEITLRIKDLNQKITAAQSVNVLLKDWEHYDSLVAAADKTQAEIVEIEGRYPHGVPTSEELDRLSAAIERDNTLKAQGQNKLFTEEDGAKFAALNLKFESGVPTDAELAEMEKNIARSNELSYAINSLNSTRPNEKEGLLRQKFAYHTPSQEEVAELEVREQRYKEAEKAYAELPDSITSQAYSPQAQYSPKLYIILAAIASILLIGGVAAIFFQTVVGAILLAVGGLGLLADGFMYLNKKTTAGTPVQTENPQKTEAAKIRDGILNQIQAYLIPYGYTMENGVAFAVASFKEDLTRYSYIVKAEQNNSSKLAQLTEQKGSVDQEISAFFTKYGVFGESFVGRLSALRSDINAYKSLKNRKESSAKNESILQQKIIENSTYINIFCQKYRIGAELLGSKFKFYLNDSNSYNSAKNTLKEQRERVAAFMREKDLSARPDGELIDIKSLNEQLIAEQDSKNSLLTEITADEYDVEKLDSLINERTAAKERLEEYKTTHALLVKTMDSLLKADRNLKDKYVKPIKDQFLYYSALLEKALGEKIVMDANFEIRYERSGKERSEKHLSSGQRSICALCFRLALIDNMYAEEKPFLILDDPFANLDEEHLSRVKVLLSELSKKLQIVYLVCHNSRAM